MSSEPTTTERVRALLFATVIVLSIVGGSVAVTASATAGFDTNDSERNETETRSHTGAATATPQRVGVTAGAAGQAPIETADGGPASLRFAEDEPHGFPTDGTATLSLPESSGVTFDLEGSSVSVVGDNATVTGTELSEHELSINVDIENGTESAIAVDGLRFVAEPEATAVDATWTFGDATGTTTIEPERMAVSGFESVLPRGADGTPENGTDFSLQPDQQDARTNGFHADGEFVGVFITEEYDDRISFDRSAMEDIEIQTSSRCNRDALAETVGARNAYIQDGVFFFKVYCELNYDDYVLLRNLQFNVSGGTVEETLDFDTTIDVKYDPVNNTDSARVKADGDDQLAVRSPTIETSTTAVESGGNATAGDEPMSVTVSDDHGGMVADGTRLTLSLTDGGVAFNASQRLDVSSDSDSFTATVDKVSSDSIVLEVDGDSSAGDSVTIQGANGTGLLFDVGSEATDTDLRVTTNSGGDDVTQRAGSVEVIDSEAGTEPDEGDGEDNGTSSDPPEDDDDTDETNGNDSEQDNDTSDSPEETSGSDSAGGSSGGVDGSSGGASTGEDSDNNVTVTESQPIEDVAPDQPGTTVEFDVGMLDSITFVDGASGTATVSVHETLPDGVPDIDGTTIQAMTIDVPESLEDQSAAVSMAADVAAFDGDPERVEVVHYDEGAGGWDSLETTVEEREGGELLFEATTPGFSLFAVQMTEEPTAAPTSTDSGRTETTDSPEETATPTAAPGGEDTDDDGLIGEAASVTGSLDTKVLLGTAILGVLVVVSGIRLYRRNDSL